MSQYKNIEGYTTLNSREKNALFRTLNGQTVYLEKFNNGSTEKGYTVKGTIENIEKYGGVVSLTASVRGSCCRDKTYSNIPGV